MKVVNMMLPFRISANECFLGQTEAGYFLQIVGGREAPFFFLKARPSLPPRKKILSATPALLIDLQPDMKLTLYGLPRLTTISFSSP